MNPERIKIFTGRSHPVLAEEMARCLGLEAGRARIKQFSDGETNLQIQENVRGADCFIVQPTCRPVDQNLIELLLFIQALKLSSAERITAVLPYYGYGRQDRKDKPRVPISAKLVAQLIETAGADRVMAVDLHAAQIQGFFDVPVDHLVFPPGDDRLFQAAGYSGSDGGFARCGRCGAGPFGGQASECPAGDYR